MQSPENLGLDDGSRVAVIGGGPAGSLFSYFLLVFAERAHKKLDVDIYDPRNFSAIGPAGCNMCGGIISESLVQLLATEGINLPETVVQRGLNSYVLHTEAGHCSIKVPSQEKRIGAVHRGGGPRGRYVPNWYSFDGHLMNMAINRGAKHISKRVNAVAWNAGRPEIRIPDSPAQSYDLLVSAVGLNSPDLALFEQLGFGYRRPAALKTYIAELPLGAEAIAKLFDDSVHIFLLNIDELDFAAFIPKGNYVTVCMLGSNIGRETVLRFFEHPAVRECFPSDWQFPKDACHCSPHMFSREAIQPFTDRLVLIGDSSTSRLFKDGLGAAYRTAKAAARTAVFEGISASDFSRHYMPECRRIQRDNRFGKVIFGITHTVRKWRIPARIVLKTIEREQASGTDEKRLSLVLWDMFTGSAPYRDIFGRCFHPAMMHGLLAGAYHGLCPLFKRHEVSKPADADFSLKGGGSMDLGKLGAVYEDGDVIVREGEDGERMYVIQEGRVKVCQQKDGQEIVLAELGTDDVFGEMALFEKEKRSATIRAIGSARVLSIDKKTFLRRVHEDPSLAFRILQQMSHRIRKLDTEVTCLRTDTLKRAS